MHMLIQLALKHDIYIEDDIDGGNPAREIMVRTPDTLIVLVHIIFKEM